VYVTLLQSDTVQEYGLSKGDTSPVGVGLRKKPKDLSASEREDRGHGEGVSTENVNERIFFFCDLLPFKSFYGPSY
jgi:hypothetical protein